MRSALVPVSSTVGPRSAPARPATSTSVAGTPVDATAAPTGAGPLDVLGVPDLVNLDYAATAPCARVAADAVAELLPWYGSVHRGAGALSQRCTLAYERARQTVGDFVGTRPDDEVIFTRNTTDALNLLARAVPAGTTVVTFGGEHHANLLPWPQHGPAAGAGLARRGGPRAGRGAARTAPRRRPGRPDPGDGHRRQQRHRRTLAGRRAGAESPTGTAPGSRSTPPNSPRTCRWTSPRWSVDYVAALRAQALRPVRHRRAGRAGRLAGRRRAVPARWRGDPRRRRRHPRRALGGRARPARGRHAEPARRGGPRGGLCRARRGRPGRVARPGAGAAGPVAGRSARPAGHRRAADLRRRRAPGGHRLVRGRRTGLRRGRRGAGPRVRHRACATACSAPTRSPGDCSPRPPAAAVGPTCRRPRCAPASAWAARSPTSTGCSTPWPSWLSPDRAG